MKISNKLLSKILFFLKNIASGDLHELIGLMQKIIDYQMEEILIYREKMLELTGKETPDLSDDQKRRLAVKGQPLGSVYFEKASSWTYDLIMKWYHTLIGQKYSSADRNKVGRPRISNETVEKILLIARECPAFGYARIRNELLKDKIVVSTTTIRRVMADYYGGADPRDGIVFQEDARAEFGGLFAGLRIKHHRRRHVQALRHAVHAAVREEDVRAGQDVELVHVRFHPDILRQDAQLFAVQRHAA